MLENYQQQEMIVNINNLSEQFSAPTDKVTEFGDLVRSHFQLKSEKVLAQKSETRETLAN